MRSGRHCSDTYKFCRRVNWVRGPKVHLAYPHGQLLAGVAYDLIPTFLRLNQERFLPFVLPLFVVDLPLGWIVFSSPVNSVFTFHLTKLRIF